MSDTPLIVQQPSYGAVGGDSHHHDSNASLAPTPPDATKEATTRSLWYLVLGTVGLWMLTGLGVALWFGRREPQSRFWDSWVDLLGLLLLVVGLAPAVSLSVVTARSVAWASFSRRSILALVAVLVVIVMVVAFVEPWVPCGLIFCTTKDEVPTAKDETRPLVMLRIAAVCAAVALGLLLSFLPGGTVDRTQLRPSSSSFAVWLLFLAAIGGVFWMEAVASRLPLDAREITPSTVASLAASPTNPSSLERAHDAHLHSFTYRINDTWWTWTPPRLAFVVFIAVLMYFNAVMISFPGCRRWLRARVFFPRTNVSFTGASLVLGLLFKLYISLTAFYWIRDADYGDNSAGYVIARAAGHLAATTMALLFFPVNRLPVVHRLMNTSRAAAMKWHVAMGYIMLALVALHVMAFAVSKQGIQWFASVLFGTTHWDQSLIAWICICLVIPGMLIFPALRQRWYDVFHAVHQLAAYALIPAVIWHAYRSWELLLPGVAALLVDRVSRIASSCRASCHASLVPVGDEYVRVEIRCPSLTLFAGQHIYLNVPEISLFEWHPFSVSSSSLHAAGGRTVTLHIKDMGATTFTGALRALAVRAGHAGVSSWETQIYVEGPYGAETDLLSTDDFDVIVLVAGGIGITPCASITEAMLDSATSVSPCLKKLTKLTLVWVCRNPRELAESLDLSPSAGPATWLLGSGAMSYSCVIHETKPPTNGPAYWAYAANKGWYVARGRPDWNSLLTEAIPLGCHRPLLITCGPVDMCDDVERAAVDRHPSTTIHRESFSL